VSNKPVCLIGGDGFIGSHLRKRLASRQAEVVVLGRSTGPLPAENEIHINVEDHRWEDVRAILGRFTYSAMIDLASASVPKGGQADPARDLAENIGTLLRHLDLARELKVEKFVYMSSGGTVYGESRGLPLKEEDPLLPQSPYGIAKLAGERYVDMYQRAHRLPAVIVRPSNIYGPGQRPFRGQGIVPIAFAAAFQGTPFTVFGDGTSVRDYLYVDDLCDAIHVVIAKADAGEVLNIGSGEGLPVIELLRSIAQAAEESGHSLDLVFKPARPTDVHSNVLDISRLHALAPWQPRIPLCDGLVLTRDWVQQFLRDCPA
jgi:UDP-glucose 4-epimerase